MTPLTYVKNGEIVEVIKLTGGKYFVDKLTNIGIYPGTKLRIVSDGEYGPMIIAVGETRIGLGRGMAQKILVRLAESTSEVKQ